MFKWLKKKSPVEVVSRNTGSEEALAHLALYIFRDVYPKAFVDSTGFINLNGTLLSVGIFIESCLRVRSKESQSA